MKCVVCIGGGGIVIIKEEPHNTFVYFRKVKLEGEL